MEELYNEERSLKKLKARIKAILGILLVLAMMYVTIECHDYWMQEVARQVEEESSQKMPAGSAPLDSAATSEVGTDAPMPVGMRLLMARYEPVMTETDVSPFQTSGTP